MTMTILQQPHFNTHDAARYLSFSSNTLRISRVTGVLDGVPAPAYRKIGRKVVYDRVVLDAWIRQFKNQPNTACQEVNI